MRKQTFLQGAAILTVAGLVSKLFGALYRIPFFRVVGSEGMGLYQMAYPLYTMLLAISSAGIPVAVSKLISEAVARRNTANVTRIFRISLAFISLFAGLTSYLLYRYANFLATDILHDPRAYYCIVAIAPAVFFVGIMSVLRGYFQGYQHMVPTACSQILEQLVRVATVLVGAYIYLPLGIEYAAAAATFGAVSGALAGGVFLAGLYLYKKARLAASNPSCSLPKRRDGLFQILGRIIYLALPISLGGLVIPVMQTLDALTVPGRLQLAGYSISRATQLYGELTGGAATLVNLPTVITISMATALVPAISNFMERGNLAEVNRQIDTSVQIAVIVCLPAAVGLAILAVPIASMLYGSPETGIPLFYLSPAVIFLGVHQVTTGVLQGMGRTFLPVLNLIFGAGLKYVLNYFLTPLPHIGIIGAAVGTIGGFMLSSYLNYIFIRYYTNWRPGFGTLLLKPLIAVTIMGIGVYFTYSQSRIVLGDSLATTIGILTGAVIYFASLAKLGILQRIGIGLPLIGRLTRR